MIIGDLVKTAPETFFSLESNDGSIRPVYEDLISGETLVAVKNNFLFSKFKMLDSNLEDMGNKTNISGLGSTLICFIVAFFIFFCVVGGVGGKTFYSIIRGKRGIKQLRRAMNEGFV